MGRSRARFGGGAGELSDDASALDWMQTVNPNASGCWIGGYSFGAWIGMQLLMRRPEIDGFIAVSPPAGSLDFSFLGPMPGLGADPARRPRRRRATGGGREIGEEVAHQKNVVVDFKAIRAPITSSPRT